MKQVVLDKADSNIDVIEVPDPILEGRGIVVKTAYSLISSGTEVSMILRARESKLDRIRRMMPEEGIISYVKRKIKSGTLVKGAQGVMSTLNKDSGKGFGNLMPIGYSSSGIAIDVDDRVRSARLNDKVACAASRHAGFNYVPENLFTRVGRDMDLKEAAFTTIGCIAMQGVRRANVVVGDNVVIIGQGLVGQIAAQLVRVSGGYSIVTDLSQWRLDLAKKLGANKIINASGQNPVEEVMRLTHGLGADKVIICASSLSARPIKDAVGMSRDKGRIVLVGNVKIEIPREPFYEKELDFLISRSYGPGRYDSLYEQKGFDYPFDMVRWTENSNMREFIRLLSEKKINVKDLITYEYDISNAREAYENIITSPDTTLGVLLKYAPDNEQADCRRKTMFRVKPKETQENKIKTAIIGCGNFARKYHLPNIKKIADYQLLSIVNATGIKAKEIAEKNNIGNYATDYREVISDPDIDLVIIATRHNLHAAQAMEALKAKKHVFLEKPMALTLEEMKELANEAKITDRKFTIGFNRRFSPLIKEAKKTLNDASGPMIINYRVANNFSQATSWIHDPREGGGTIIGECCHFFDLIYHIIGKEPVRIFAEGGNLSHPGDDINDNAIISIKYSDGSIATITFTDMGIEGFPKERIEIFAQATVIVIDDFKKMTARGKKNAEIALKQSDKGHLEQFIQLRNCIKEDLEPSITYKDGVRATLCGIMTLESLKTQLPQKVNISGYF